MQYANENQVADSMRYKFFILISCSLLCTILLPGQCPDRDALWKQLTNLNATYLFRSEIPPKEELPALLASLDKMNDCPYRNDSTHISLLRVIARIYLLKADFLKGIKYYQQAIHIIRTNIGKPSIKPEALSACYYWLSVAYDSLNNFTEKMKALDSCYAISIRLNYIDPTSFRALFVWALHFFDLGDYHRCIDYAQRCESLAREHINNNGIYRARAEEFASSSFLWSVKALLELKNYDEAEKRLRNRMEEYKKAGRNNNLGTIFSQLAELQLRKGNYERALLFYKQAFKQDQLAGYDFNCKQTLKDIGFNIYFRHYNDETKALSFYREALKIINKNKDLNTDDAFESLNIFADIANVYARRGLYDSAYHYFHLAFDQIKPGTNETDILHSSPDDFFRFKKIYYLTSLLIDKGDVFQRQYILTGKPGAIQNAIRAYKMADEFLDRVRTEQSDQQSKLFWRSDSRRLYENAIKTCYLNKDIANAFYFFERSRAVLLQDQLGEQHLMDEEDIMKQTQLVKKIRKLKASAGSDEEIFTNQLELERLKRGIKEKNPLYYQSFVDTDFITVRDVQQKMLKDRQALVELFDGDSAVYVMLITAQKSYLQKINKTDFDSLSTAYMAFLSDHEKLNRSFNEFTKLSLQLYQLIFKNINLPGGRIIISPDGKYFPFEALVTGITNQTPAYLQENNAVSYTYSAKYLLNRFTNPSGNGHAFIGIAPLKYPGGGLDLPELTGSDRSLGEVKKYFSNSTSLIGNKATKNNFLQEYYKYKIIQLYTHATDSGYAGEPMIYFSDSALLLSDLVYQNKPATSLIVLSACQTASGKLYNGEGVFSFNREFAALGVPASISNLWNVDDQSSYRLTELFYKYLSRGLPADVALQSAKKEFISTTTFNENKLPYYWAAPILVGQSESIYLSKSFPWKWLAAMFLLLALIFWQGRKWARQRS